MQLSPFAEEEIAAAAADHPHHVQPRTIEFCS